jgi:RNA-binding protein
MAVHLTPRERAHLKARAHPLEPTVQLGHGGLSDAVAAEIDRALTAHELIKVKVNAADREAREALCDAICARSDAAEVQRVGKVLVLWRPRPLDDNPPGTDYRREDVP